MGRIEVNRRTMLVAALGGMAGLMAACSPSAPPAPAAPAAKSDAKPAPKAEAKPAAQAAPAKAAGGKATLQMWFDIPGTQQEHINKVNAKFMAENPNIELKMTIVPVAELPTKLATAVAGGAPPDIAYIGGPSIISNLIDAKKVESMSKFKKDFGTLDWLEPIKKVLGRGDDFYALPVNSGILGLYYNEELYKASGLDPAKPPATWDELVKSAKAIAKPADQVWGHYVGTKPVTWSADQVWISYLWSAGGEWLSPDNKQAAFNSPAGVEALQFYVDLVNEHKVTPLKPIDNIVTGNDFETGKIGHMTLYPIWTVRAAQMKFPVRTAPMVKHKQAGAPLGMGSMPIFSDSKNKEAAFSYIEWLMKPENAVFWVSGLGNLPTRPSISGSQAWKDHVAKYPLIQPFVDAQPQARVAYFGKGAQEVATLVGQAIENAVYKRKSAKDALDEAAKQANEVLGRA